MISMVAFSLLAVTWNLNLLVVILEVAFGLGMVIFVHELGHFAVAKMCGVKCEKFYLGFDIYGLKLFKYQWGETEYGIGILPLGGYVKMLGQDDNPGRAAEERERSKVALPEAAEGASHVTTTGESYTLDPRSYMAKSVPQRMAIISAGVIMNVIFAVLMAAVAYSLGVTEPAAGVSATVPGQAAWKADLQPGDEFIEIGDSGDRQLRFRDLMAAVALGDIQQGVNFKVKREGVPEPFVVNIKPDPDKNPLRPTIGVVPPATSTLADGTPVAKGSPAAKADTFQASDKIIAVNGAPIQGYADLIAELTRHADKPLRFTVERPEASSEKDKKDKGQGDGIRILETAEVQPQPMRTLGLVMKMGKITAIQDHSPAAKNDVRPGDFIVSIDGAQPGDPLRLGEVLRRRAGETIKLVLSRPGASGKDEEVEKEITLQDRPWPEDSDIPGSPTAVPALGITYKVLNIVHEAEKDSPAAQAELTMDGKPASVSRLAGGDEIVKAEFILPPKSAEKDAADEAPAPREIKPLEFSAEKPNWPFFNTLVQRLPAGTKIKLTLKDGRATTLESVDAREWFAPERGLNVKIDLTTTKAHSFGEALAMGFRETRDSVLQVYLFLRRIGSQVSVFSLGGPVTIAGAAGEAAFSGLPQLLIFLTLLSANLAVINFLPIPLLDGGHMVFLALEGILRRPVSEKVIIAFHYVGFVFIISLMLFVLGLDFGLIPRPH